MNPKSITILGSTGSIGRSTLAVVDQCPHDYQVFALVGAKNWQQMAQDILRYSPQYACLTDPKAHQSLIEALPAQVKTEILPAIARSCCDIAQMPVDLSIAAITGIAGLEPTMAALRAGNQVALANKESLVCAGALMLEQVHKDKPLLPLDSEHSAIFQCLVGEKSSAIEKVTLTASGGPFRTFSQEQLKNVTSEQALAHPNWSMGAKLTIDSATLMNKGAEYIEALHLFCLNKEQLDVVVHPQSLVHSFVAFHDGSVKAQLGSTDMTAPIGYAMAYPERKALPQVKRLNWAQLGRLDFEAPRDDCFPLLKLAQDVAFESADKAIVMNAANEIAVQAFLEGQIDFNAISTSVQQATQMCHFSVPTSISEVLEIDAQTRLWVRKQMAAL